MTVSKNVISVDLGNGERGAQRRIALQKMASEHKLMWNGKPSIGRLVKSIADETRHWWHWAVRTDAGCHAIYESGVRVNTAYPWRGVRDGDIKENGTSIMNGHWRAQPFLDPGETDGASWNDEVSELREMLNESAGVFYVEYINYNRDAEWGSGFSHTPQNGVLIAVNSDGNHAVWKRVL